MGFGSAGHPSLNMRRLRIQPAPPALLLALVACASVEPDTGEVGPRGNQGSSFTEVKENADNLRLGLTKIQVVLLLGTPAKKDGPAVKDGATSTWVYLPERPAVIVPERALRLEFKDGRLVDFGYHAIVQGQRL